ncbi:hypothetical protein RUM43_003745 [Polyplax serrata]|uniref:Uncharacterized protein n=1 Tax=Polyplax serrata TaxID=468196 RepID=A0AAN8NVX8_POLSC
MKDGKEKEKRRGDKRGPMHQHDRHHHNPPPRGLPVISQVPDEIDPSSMRQRYRPRCFALSCWPRPLFQGFALQLTQGSTTRFFFFSQEYLFFFSKYLQMKPNENVENIFHPPISRTFLPSDDLNNRRSQSGRRAEEDYYLLRFSDAQLQILLQLHGWSRVTANINRGYTCTGDLDSVMVVALDLVETLRNLSNKTVK